MLSTVYDLREDPDSVRSMQQGSTSAGSSGLRVTHGLVGSDEWWRQLESGVLPLHTLRGRVTGCSLGVHDGGPVEFELKEPNGNRSTWLVSKMDPRSAKACFRLNRGIEVDFVRQERKVPFEEEAEAKVLVAVRVVLG